MFICYGFRLLNNIDSLQVFYVRSPEIVARGQPRTMKPLEMISSRISAVVGNYSYYTACLEAHFTQTQVSAVCR